MSPRTKRSSRTKTIDAWIEGLCVLLLAFFLVASLYTAFMFYLTVKTWAASYGQSSSLAPSVIKGVVNPAPIPENNQEVREVLALPDIKKGERINVLLLGVDQRPNEKGPCRTDTIILLTLDPASKTAGMLSIPRDLWVPIPGFGEGRINTANYLGDRYNYPGGGPALAKKTVQYNFGIPVHYYVRINFEGFKRIIDLIGGIDIYVEKDINDPTFPAYEGDGYDPLYIPAGWHHMDGELALKYARTRHGSSDFDRARRQQQVIMAVRDKVLKLNMLPKLLPKLPQLLQNLSDSIQTDMPVEVMMDLVPVVKEIEPQNIRRAVIDQSMTIRHITPAGADVLIPVREKIRPLIDELFATPTPVIEEPVLEEIEEQQRLSAEGAKIIVQNGTEREELAAKVTQFLIEQGYQVVAYGPADRTDYEHTVIINYTDKTYTLEQLALLFNVRPEEIRFSPVNQDNVDIRVIVGNDFHFPNDK
ncbi:MAG TPA: LytR family transcriptional regulator [Chloroflexi bacterium]|nr:LytR family transcriptional regulator [Chloroflexota bacterium]